MSAAPGRSQASSHRSPQGGGLSSSAAPGRSQASSHRSTQGGGVAASLSRRALQAVLLGAALLLAAPASAEIWGFIDRKGRTHYADHQIDARYELLYRSGTGSPKRPLGMAPGTSSAQIRFEVSTGYKAVRHLVREASEATGVDVELLKAVIATESAFNAHAVSPKGAVGLMQLMPDTARRFGVRPEANETLHERLTDPRTNLNAGARYLAWLLKFFDGDLRLALAAYNAGEGAVLRAGRQIPNYRETQDYVRKVTQLHQTLVPPSLVSRPRGNGAG